MVDLLRGDGLVERLPGVGTMIVAKKYSHGLDRLMGLAETLHEHGVITNEVRAAGPITPPPAVAARLALPDDEPTVYIERLRKLNGLPLSLDLTYLPVDVAGPLVAEDLVNRDIFGLIEELTGRRLGTADIGMDAVNADPHSAAVLGIPRGTALLLVERLTRFDDGRPIDYVGPRTGYAAQLVRRHHQAGVDPAPTHPQRAHFRWTLTCANVAMLRWPGPRCAGEPGLWECCDRRSPWHWRGPKCTFQGRIPRWVYEPKFDFCAWFGAIGRHCWPGPAWCSGGTTTTFAARVRRHRRRRRPLRRPRGGWRTG